METLQPKLRFSGFEGDWGFKNLREISSLITKGTTPKEFAETGIYYIKTDCFINNIIDLKRCSFIDKSVHLKELKRSIINENDLLFTITGATIGKCVVVDKSVLPANTNQNLAIIRLNKGEDKDYIFQNLTSERMNKYILDNSTIGAQPSLNLEQIGSFTFPYPIKEEQIRIANFLSSVDEKLNLLKEKKELLEEYKKGMMQKIFNQEIRFKDDNGEDFEEWEEKSFKSTIKSIATKKHQIQSSEIFEKGKYPVIDQGKKMVAGFSDNLKNLFNDYPVIVFGDHTTILKYIDFDFIVGADGTKLLKNINNDNLKYLYYNIIYNNVEQEGYKRHFSILSEISLQLPSLKEQTKIANFLSAIDEKIDLIANQIQDTQEYKKGLLQQMFV